MNCECIERVNAKLAEADHQYRLNTAFVFRKDMNDVGENLSIETCWCDLSKKGKKPPSILCTFCPFCGTKTAKDGESAAQGK